MGSPALLGGVVGLELVALTTPRASRLDSSAEPFRAARETLILPRRRGVCHAGSALECWGQSHGSRPVDIL